MVSERKISSVEELLSLKVDELRCLQADGTITVLDLKAIRKSYQQHNGRSESHEEAKPELNINLSREK